jgi:hypothetical protein
MIKRYSQKHQQLYILILQGEPFFYEPEPSTSRNAAVVSAIAMAAAMCENHMYYKI